MTTNSAIRLVLLSIESVIHTVTVIAAATTGIPMESVLVRLLICFWISPAFAFITLILLVAVAPLRHL